MRDREFVSTSTKLSLSLSIFQDKMGARREVGMLSCKNYDKFKARRLSISEQLTMYRKGFNLLTLTLIYLVIATIPQVQPMSIKQFEDISYNIHVTDSIGHMDLSHCMDGIRTKLRDNTDNPFYASSRKDIRDVNYTCNWTFNSKTSSDFAVQFKIHQLDLPKCLEPSLRFDPEPADSEPSPTATLNVFSIRASRPSVIFRHSTTCPLKGTHGFHITYETHQHQRRRRDAPSNSEQSNNLNPSSTVSEQLGKSQGSHQPTLKPSDSSSSNPDNNDSDSSDNSWKIAVGVVIPVIILSIILIAAYRIYRKKFPVRMIMGRQFSTFRNPKYQRPTSGLNLVRDETDWNQMANRASTEYNPEYQTSNMKIPYENKGFDYDDVDFNDESREDRDFRIKKSWLFRSKEDQSEEVGESSHSRNDDDVDDIDGEKKKNIDEDKEYSDDSDIEAMLQEQKVTPKLKRKNVSESDLSTSSTSSEQIATETNATQSDHSFSSKVDESDEKAHSREDEDQVGETKSDFVEKFEPLYQLQTIDEVRAELKARARSMSGSKCPKPDRPRSFSLQIDPTKSARRGSGSLNDFTTAGSDLRRFVQMQNVTASVVGVAYLSTSVRAMYSSLSSVSSNPHLVTDLDDDISEGSGSLGGSKRSDMGIGDEGGEKLPDNIHTESKQIVNPDSSEEIKTETKAGTDESGRFEVEVENPTGNISESQSSYPSESQMGKDKMEDSVDGSKRGDEGFQSTSGSSSSSDTHVEEHAANMTKPHYTPQTSTVSALSDQPTVGIKEDSAECVDKDDERSESVGDTLDKQHILGGNEELYHEVCNKEFVDTSSVVLHEKGSDQSSTNLSNNESESLENSNPSGTESISNKETDDQSKESTSYDNISAPSDLNKVDDAESNEDMGCKHESISPTVGNQEVMKETDNVVQQAVGEDRAVDCVGNKRNDDKHGDSPLDINRDSGAQDLHEAPNGSQTDTTRTQGDTRLDVDSGKKKITTGSDDVASDDDCSKSPSVSASDTDSDFEGESDPDSHTDTKGSYSFQSSQQQIDTQEHHRDFINDGNVEENAYSSGGENNLDNHTMDNQTLNDIVASASKESPKDAKVHGGGKVRIISKLELSDVSSDSSDVLDDVPGSFVPARTNNQSNARTDTSMKKISFDLSNFTRDDDYSDDDDESIASGESDNNNNEYDLNVRDNKVELSNPTSQNNDKITIKHNMHGHDDSDQPRNDNALSIDASKTVQTSSGEAFDVYNEFSDDVIDGLLSESNDNDVKNIDVVDSNSNVTTQRPIGIDPDIKFSFDSKTQVNIRDDHDEDDIDV